MTEIIASILSPAYTYEEMKNKIAVLRGAISTIQIDFCDGIFVKAVTWPFTSGGFEDYDFQKIINEEKGMPFWEDVDFELDLMVANAVPNFDLYMKLGPKAIIFHIEAVGDLGDFKDFLEGIDPYMRDIVQIGIALNPSTSFEQLYPLVSHIDFVQLMGNDRIGFTGVTLDPRVYERIKLLREKYSDLPIEIDIGVTQDTVPLLVKAGATKLIIGSAIWKSVNPLGALEEFQSLV